MRYPKLVNVVKKSLDEHKAENIVVEDVRDLTPFSDYYVVATAPNERAVGALADYLVEDLAKAKQEDPKISGTPSSGWVIVDDGSVVAHIFTEEERNEIDLVSLVQEHLKKKKR
jgi:ribosome-associated protein